jgi:hypothetical protein
VLEGIGVPLGPGRVEAPASTDQREHIDLLDRPLRVGLDASFGTELFDVNLTISGLVIRFAIGLRLTGKVALLEGDAPRVLGYHRACSVVFRQSGRFSTVDRSLTPFEQAISPGTDVDLDSISSFQATKPIQLKFTPSIHVSIVTSIIIGNDVNWRAEVGVGLTAAWVFAGASDICPFPYLYGDITLSAIGFFQVGELTITELSPTPLIPRYSQNQNLFDDLKSDMFCVFLPGSEKTVFQTASD